MDEEELALLGERDLSIKAGEKQSMVFASKVKAVNSEKGTVDVIMSDASIDRYMEVIDPRAWKKGLANYKKHPVLLSSHNYHGLTNQIGKAESIKVNKDGQLEAKMKYFVGKGNPEADWGFFLAEEGVAAYSVGFIPKAYVYNSDESFKDLAKEIGYSKKEAEGIRVIFTDVELLENSHVLVPANPAGLLKGMESEEVKSDPLLKGLYTEALAKIDSFKDFFETEGAATISKSFGAPVVEEESAGRVKRVKKVDGSGEIADGSVDTTIAEKGEGMAEVLAAIKGLDVKEVVELDAGEDDDSNEADMIEILAAFKELKGKDENSEEIAAFWDMAKGKGFTIAELFEAIEKSFGLESLESGGPAAPSKDASDDLPAGEMVGDENPINDDGSIELKDGEELESEEKDLSAEDAAESVVDDLDLDTSEKDLEEDDKIEKGVVPFRAMPLMDESVAWRAADARRRIKNWAGGPSKDDVSWAKYQRGFTWYDGEDADNFGAYKMPHHDVSEGELKTVWRGVASAMGVMLGAMGGVDVPDADRKKMYNHLAKHYAEFDKEVPDFKAYASPEEVLAEVKDADTAVALLKSLAGAVEEESSPEVEAIKDATDEAIAKINAALKTASEQFSSLTIESSKTQEKLLKFESELTSVKTLLTDLELNKIEVKEVEEVTKESMRDLLTGIKDATAKIGAKEVPPEDKG